VAVGEYLSKRKFLGNVLCGNKAYLGVQVLQLQGTGIVHFKKNKGFQIFEHFPVSFPFVSMTVCQSPSLQC